MSIERARSVLLAETMSIEQLAFYAARLEGERNNLKVVLNAMYLAARQSSTFIRKNKDVLDLAFNALKEEA